MRFLALAFQSVDAGLERVPRSLDEAARGLGCDRLDVLARVHVPMISGALLTAALLVFTEVMKELPATLLLRPLGGDTLAMAVWQATSESLYETAALPALLIVLVGLLPVARADPPLAEGGAMSVRLQGVDEVPSARPRGRRRGPRVPDGELVSRARPVRMRQDHSAAADRGVRDARRRDHRGRREDRRRPRLLGAAGEAADRDGVPGLRAVPAPRRARERGLRARRRSADERERLTRRTLELVGLQHKADRYPHELSGGERQRVALARALAPEPEVVLLDEPFSSLDATLRADLRREVELILREAGATALLVTHDQEEALGAGGPPGRDARGQIWCRSAARGGLRPPRRAAGRRSSWAR